MMIKMFFALSAALSFPTEAKPVTTNTLMPSYILIQEALAKDDLAMAQSKATDLEKLMSDARTKFALGSLAKAKSIGEARNQFKKVSSYFVKWIEKNKSTEFEIVYCPMAGAKWVQKKGEVQNPYYGKEMLNCGEKGS